MVLESLLHGIEERDNLAGRQDPGRLESPLLTTGCGP